MGDYWDVHYTGNGDESLIDLDFGEIWNYGADIEIEQFLRNIEGTHGYEELRIPTDVDVFRIFAEGRILRERKGRKARNFSQYNKKLTGTFKGRNGFRKMQANVGKLEKWGNLLKENKRV